MEECHASDAEGVDKRTLMLMLACADTTALQGISIDEELKTASSPSKCPK